MYLCTTIPESESLRGSLLISSLASFFPSFLPIKRVVRQERGGGGGRFTVTLFFCCSPVSCAPASSSVFFSQEWKIASLGIRQIRFPIKNIRKLLSFNRFISASFLAQICLAVWRFSCLGCTAEILSLSFSSSLFGRGNPPGGEGEGKGRNVCPGELSRITLGQQEEETSAMPIGGSSSEGGGGESCWEKMKERIKAKK